MVDLISNFFQFQRHIEFEIAFWKLEPSISKTITDRGMYFILLKLITKESKSVVKKAHLSKRTCQISSYCMYPLLHGPISKTGSLLKKVMKTFAIISNSNTCS